MDEEEAGLAGSFTKVIKIFTPQVKHEIKIIKGSAEEQANELYLKLKELKVF